MRTIEEKKIYLQVAFEKAFPKAEQIITFTEKLNGSTELLTVKVIVKNKAYWYTIALADIEERMVNFDIFARKVDEAGKTVEQYLKEDGLL